MSYGTQNNGVQKRGTFKRHITNLEVNNGELSQIISCALLENGYDIIAEPIRDINGMFAGEKLAIYKEEPRQMPNEVIRR
jgi:hypothetical protein